MSFSLLRGFEKAASLPALLRYAGRKATEGELDVWVLETPIVFVADAKRYEIPAMSLTDLASTPWYLTWLVKPSSVPWLTAAAIHDHAYAGLADSQKQADQWFRSVALIEGASPFSARAAYWGLRLGGRGSWKRNRRKLAELGPGWRALE